MYRFDTTGQMTMLDLDTAERGGAPPKRRSGKPDSELVSIPYFHLDLLSSPVDLFGQRHWEFRSPWREGKRPLNTGAAPRRPIRVSLSGILEAYPALKYYLSKTACLGILRRAFERGKDLPKMLARALKIQAGLMKPDSQPTDLKAFHVNQRNEGIDLNGVSGALMATTNMQMQTFVTQPNGAAEGFDGYNGVMAFAANQRDEVRDLCDVAGALGAQPGMKQQTFVAGFSAGAGAKAGGIGYNEAEIPLELHTKVRQRQAESGETLSRYMTALITKFYEMEENVKMDKDNVRTVAFQVPTELFEQLKAYLKRNGIKQNAFFLDCIRQALADDTGAGEE